MASDNGEPGFKRARSETLRCIEVDMSNYDISVQKMSDDELVKIFELGLKVRESAMLTVDVNQKIVEDALASKMKLIHDSVAKIEQQVTEQVEIVKNKVTQDVGKQMEDAKKNVESLQGKVSEHMTEIKDELTKRVETVSQKVQPLDVLNSTVNRSALDIKTQISQAINNSEDRVSKELTDCKEKLAKISSALEKPASKGARAERKVIDVLHENLSNFTTSDTSSTLGKGDIEVQTPNNHRIMIEVKNQKESVARDEIESFESNLAKSPQLKVGILLSMKSGIARRAREGRFEIAFNQQKQYQIYVPNAHTNNEDHLIVWSVVMAEQLANMEGGDLDETKTHRLKEVYNKFKENIQHGKNCKTNLEALQVAVENLKSSITPILETIDKTKEDIYKVLH